MYKKVNKKQARKLFLQRYDIYLLPCKVNLQNMWIKPCIISIVNKENGKARDVDFDKLVNEYEYYNCNYNELGKYASYYIKEVE